MRFNTDAALTALAVCNTTPYTQPEDTFHQPSESHGVPLTPITDLEIFARVAAAGNMSAAGRDMGLSPAVVSKRISHMEERLGLACFSAPRGN